MPSRSPRRAGARPVLSELVPRYFNCVAVSQTPDPTGAYYRWAFSNGTNFPDYPKYGFWSDALYISTRDFAGGSTFSGIGAIAINRAQLIAGNPAPTMIMFQATPASAGGATGSHAHGLSPPSPDRISWPWSSTCSSLSLIHISEPTRPY